MGGHRAYAFIYRVCCGRFVPARDKACERTRPVVWLKGRDLPLGGGPGKLLRVERPLMTPTIAAPHGIGT